MHSPFNKHNRKSTFDQSLVSDEAIARQARAEDDGTRLPSVVVDRLIQGENPVKVMREWKNLTQAQLSKTAKLSKNFISMLETGRRPLTNKTSQLLAIALDVSSEVFE